MEQWQEFCLIRSTEFKFRDHNSVRITSQQELAALIFSFDTFFAFLQLKTIRYVDTRGIIYFIRPDN